MFAPRGRCQHHGRALLLGTLLGFACTGSIDSDQTTGAEPVPATPPSKGGPIDRRPNAPVLPVSSGSLPNDGTLACSQMDAIAPGPLAHPRLTKDELEATLESLFAGTGLKPPPLDLPGEAAVHGFLNNVSVQAPAPALVEAYASHVEAVARLAVTRVEALAPCNGDPKACGAKFIDAFGARAFRRPLATHEASAYRDFFNQALASYDYKDAVGMSVQAFLLAPEFLHKLERGQSVDGRPGLLRLTDHELATRLSYALTGTMPDPELLALANQGTLSTGDNLARQARRLLDRTRATGLVNRFHDQWLGIDRIVDLNRSPELYKDFTEATQSSLRTSLRTTMAHLFWEQDSLTRLFTGTEAVVDATVARLYGVTPPPGGTGLVNVDPSGTRRAGFLTHPAWLTLHASSTNDDPIHRGLFVKENVLCGTPPPFPDTVDLSKIPEPKGPVTSRQRLEAITSEGSCKACHSVFSEYGYAFGHYDAVGAWRERDSGLAIDASGQFRDGEPRPFSDAVDMAKQMATREDVQACLSKQWFRFLLGRTETSSDACNLRRVLDRSKAAGGSLQQMVLAIVQSDAFVYRQEAP